MNTGAPFTPPNLARSDLRAAGFFSPQANSVLFQNMQKQYKMQTGRSSNINNQQVKSSKTLQLATTNILQKKTEVDKSVPSTSNVKQRKQSETASGRSSRGSSSPRTRKVDSPLVAPSHGHRGKRSNTPCRSLKDLHALDSVAREFLSIGLNQPELALKHGQKKKGLTGKKLISNKRAIRPSSRHKLQPQQLL